MRNFALRVAGIGSLLFFAASAPTFAQSMPPADSQAAPGAGSATAPQPGMPPMQQQQQQDVSKAQLQQFVQAFRQVQTVQQKYEPALKAKDPKKVQDVQNQAAQEMVSGIQKSGMTVQQYNQIAQTLNSNPDLRQKVLAMLNQQDQ